MQCLKLDQQLKALVKTERKITHEILLLIQTLDITKSYRELGYASLFEYLTKEIGYSEGSAQRRISASRLIKQCPQIENELKSGNLNLTQVALAQTAIKQEEKAQEVVLPAEKKSEIINKLKNRNGFETKKILKAELPNFEIPQSKVVPANSNRIHVTLEFSESDWEKVQSLMAQMSHKVPSQKLEDLLLYWMNHLDQKERKKAKIDGQRNSLNKDLCIDKTKKETSLKISPPQRKLELSMLLEQSELSELPKQSKTLEQSTENPIQKSKTQNKRQYISVHVQRELKEKSHNRCEYISPITNKRCESKHFLEQEHIVPIALGGSNNKSNLRIYCRSHNQLASKEWGVSLIR